MNEYTIIGKIYKSNILKNSWIAYINNINLIKRSTKLFFIKLDGILTPFFIYYYKQINKNKFLLNFDHSANEENFLGKNLYLKIKELKNNEIKNYDYLINYKAIDINKGYIGIINNINYQLPQFLFEIIDYNNLLILIPIVNIFIKKINKLKKIIMFDLPEGLIDLFL